MSVWGDGWAGEAAAGPLASPQDSPVLSALGRRTALQSRSGRGTLDSSNLNSSYRTLDMATTSRHREIVSSSLEYARAELRRGDLLQASEKAWGAVAHDVKSIAKEHGWNADSHSDVNRSARRLIQLTDDPEGNGRRLRSVNALHANFYEDFFTEDDVREGIEDAQQLVRSMDAGGSLLPSPPRRT